MLEAKGLVTVEDLLSYAPFRYEDRTNMKTIAQLAPGEMATVIAEVQSARLPASGGAIWALLKPSSRIHRAAVVAKWFHGGYLADLFSPASAWRCSARSNSIATPATC